MTLKSPLLALCSAVALQPAADGVPEWVHLLPAGAIRTVDGRGPYTVASMQALAAASLKDGQKLPLDENHATDKGAALGLAAPARGWIVALECRDDGLWGRVEWTGTGKALMEDKAYAGISPVIAHTKDGRVLQLLRASLTNTPNLTGLVSLHSEETPMDWKAKLIELLGLDSNADDATILAALQKEMSDDTVAAQSQNLLDHPAVVSLQTQLTSTADELAAIKRQGALDRSTAYVDAAIREGRIGLKPLRDEYIALHSENPERAIKLITALPKIGGQTVAGDVVTEDGAPAFDPVDNLVMSAFGVSEDDYKAALAKRGLSKEAL